MKINLGFLEYDCVEKFAIQLFLQYYIKLIGRSYTLTCEDVQLIKENSKYVENLVAKVVDSVSLANKFSQVN